ncbi:MAG: glycogen synthase [Lachnospiraceae bacterium]|nr:glycogen synthase [Lachnospiraceae bacterium]
MKKTKVLFVTSECAPFIKTGGLSDVAGALPKYFDKDRYDVRVILPRYGCMDNSFFDHAEFVAKFQLSWQFPGDEAVVIRVLKDGVTYYFVEAGYTFSGSWPYSDVGNDIWKFAVFCNAVVTFLFLPEFQPDVLHLNDWQTALIPVYKKQLSYENPSLNAIRTVFTIHNLKFQGVYDIPGMRSKTWLGEEWFGPNGLEYFGNGNLLKGAVMTADRVTTVSDTYREEIMTREYGEGLDGVMRFRSNVLSGIVNGIDTKVYDPETDSLLAKNYSVSDRKTGKRENKLALQKELGLAEDPDRMLIGIVSRLTDQKGMDLIASVLDEVLDNHTEVVLLGTGDPGFEWCFREAANRHPGTFSANLYFSEALSRRIYAATDAFLMPSRFEPCGLSQLIALRYGSLPVVRETGGLKDTVKPYNRFTDEGTGFSFARYDRGDLMFAVNYAKTLFFTDKGAFDRMVRRAMEEDFSWNSSARKYEALYDELVKEER